MLTISHHIQDPQGLHARVAGLLVKEAVRCTCAVRVGTPEKLVDAKNILGVMCLSLKSGQEMTMRFEGEGETDAAAFFERFLAENI